MRKSSDLSGELINHTKTEIYRQLLSRAKTMRGLSIDQAKYELVGTNGAFLVQPT